MALILTFKVFSIFYIILRLVSYQSPFPEAVRGRYPAEHSRRQWKMCSICNCKAILVGVILTDPYHALNPIASIATLPKLSPVVFVDVSKVLRGDSKILKVLHNLK